MLGFVGAGGVGLVYAENMRLWNWDVVMFLTVILVVVVMVMDAISSRLRKRYITGKGCRCGSLPCATEPFARCRALQRLHQLRLLPVSPAVHSGSVTGVWRRS